MSDLKLTEIKYKLKRYMSVFRNRKYYGLKRLTDYRETDLRKLTVLLSIIFI